MSEEELKVYSLEEVSKHNSASDLWIVYNGGVYDISRYIDEHPGGEEVVVDVAGTDATEPFEDIGHSDDAREILSGLLIGKVEGGVVKPPTSTHTQTEEGGYPVGVIGAAVVLLAVAVYFYVN